MNPCFRGPAPALLHEYGNEIAQEYITKRSENPAHKFRWPQRSGQSLYKVAYAALVDMSELRCAYCDGHPIDATGEEQIDHFRPKSRKEFYGLVCSWDNLFLICSACNKAKLSKWDEALLRPDEQGFAFSRYFSYRTDTGKLEPNAAASRLDQHRAEQTIKIFGLNRAGACTMRQWTVKSIQRVESQIELDDLGYRYLIPLCRTVVKGSDSLILGGDQKSKGFYDEKSTSLPP